MREHDVGAALCVSVTIEDFPKVLALAEHNDMLYASVGVHPDYPDLRDRQWPNWSNWRGIESRRHGETGLDYTG